MSQYLRSFTFSHLKSYVKSISRSSFIYVWVLYFGESVEFQASAEV